MSDEGCGSKCLSRSVIRISSGALFFATKERNQIKVVQNPKYSVGEPIPDTLPTFKTADIPPDHREDLTQEEKDTIRDWVKDSKPFNNALRHDVNHEYFNGDSAKYEKALSGAAILSDVIERSKLEDGYQIQRGLGPYDIDKVKNALYERELTGVSPLITDKGFVAVSTEFQSAHKYSAGDEKEETYILLSKLKRGKKALFIGNENLTHDKKQGEILLQAGTGYYIIGDDVDTKVTGEVVHLISVVFVEDKYNG